MSADGNFRNEQLRMPPQSVQAEQAVLGGLMLMPAALAKISDWLHEDDFYRHDHQLIWRAIYDMATKEQPCDAVTLADWFESQGKSDQVDGGAYLVELQSTTPSAANIVAYAEIVADKSRLRKMIEVGTDMVNSGFQPDGRDTRDIMATVQQQVASLVGNPRIGGVKTMRDVGRRWFDELQTRYADDTPRGLQTPWGKFNGMVGGLNPGELIVVAGRPSMGKSAFAVNVATANALRGKRVMFFNLEMTDTSIYNRAIASIMDVPLSWLRRPQDGDVDYWPRVTEGVRLLRDAALLIDDSPALSLDQVVARTKREHMRQPVDLVIVDHLHLMPLPGKTRETVEIGHITGGLKRLGKELGCPVLLLSQLNRGLESRVNKRPNMADLRESGNIEQDADVIVFLYRDDYYAERDERESEAPGLVEIIIAKQREGETGKVWAKSRLAYGAIDDYEGDAPMQRKQAPPRHRGFDGVEWSRQ